MTYVKCSGNLRLNASQSVGERWLRATHSSIANPPSCTSVSQRAVRGNGGELPALQVASRLSSAGWDILGHGHCSTAFVFLVICLLPWRFGERQQGAALLGSEQLGIFEYLLSAAVFKLETPLDSTSLQLLGLGVVL